MSPARSLLPRTPPSAPPSTSSPRPAQGRLDRGPDAAGYIVLAMGKHGALELNYSSDIDLIVFFDPIACRLPRRRRAAALLRAPDARSGAAAGGAHGDGYVFRTDLRLRPDPGATQIALSTDAALNYYESFGQNWERAALIKARACAGDIDAGERFLRELAPFIWRKYLDFAAIADMHAMKRQIHAFAASARSRVAGHNIKLGRGGIREIEFFVQTQQLIAGGRQPELRVPRTLDALASARASAAGSSRDVARRADRGLSLPARASSIACRWSPTSRPRRCPTIRRARALRARSAAMPDTAASPAR